MSTRFGQTILLLSLFAAAGAEVFFQEDFDGDICFLLLSDPRDPRCVVLLRDPFPSLRMLSMCALHSSVNGSTELLE